MIRPTEKGGAELPPADDPLPYRAGPDELAAWLEARACGRELSAGELDMPNKVYEGTVSALHALGLADRESGGSLSEAGTVYALASGRGRRSQMGELILGFPPYAALLAAIAKRDSTRVTELQWIERWWNTAGFGSSSSNRSEGAVVFAKLAEWAQLGRFVAGRRGHPSRIEWAEGALGAAPATPVSAAGPEPAPPQAAPLEIARLRLAPAHAAFPATVGLSVVHVELERGQSAHISVPPRLSSAEKKRLLSLLDLMVSVADE